MKNFSKKLSSFFAAFAIVFTMGTAATTMSAEACHHSCPSLKYYETNNKALARYWKSYNNQWLSTIFSDKSDYYRNQYNEKCQPTGSVYGYVFIDNTAQLSDGMAVTITESDGNLLHTSVNSMGKWSIPNVKAGTASIYINENHVDNLNQTYGQNSSTIRVVPDKVNDAGVDIFSVTIEP